MQSFIIQMFMQFALCLLLYHRNLNYEVDFIELPNKKNLGVWIVEE